MWYILKNFFGMSPPTNPPPRRQLFREKNLGVPLKAWPPQLLEASYAPVYYNSLHCMHELYNNVL